MKLIMNNATINETKSTELENQSEEYKSKILSKLTIERHFETEEYLSELKEKELMAKKDGKIFAKKYIPSAKLIAIDNFEGNILIIPDDIEVIGEGIFMGKDFEKIVLPKNLRFIENSAFKDCKKLKEVVFNDNLISIGEEAFSNCQSLKKIELAENVSYIGKKCFESCKALEQVIFNDNNVIMTINEDAFGNCESLKRVVLPQSLRKIEKGAFNHCSSLSEINFPEFLGFIGWGAFWGCKSLKEVDLSNHYVFIDYQAFALCGVEQFVLPKNIIAINGMALYKTQIKELTIPKSVRLLGRNSLMIDTLERVYIKDNEQAEKIILQFENAGISNKCKIIKY